MRSPNLVIQGKQFRSNYGSVALVCLLHGQLLQVPEVLIKLSAGIILMAFGTFWLGEGLEFDWLLGELAILALIGSYASVATAAYFWLKNQKSAEKLENI
jgi:Ca2+/H+ antiporter, TMEM165/GDT1 family